MKEGITQEEVEQLLRRRPAPEGETVPSLAIIYFTAKWCTACKKLDLPRIIAAASAFPEGAAAAAVATATPATWYKCDADENTYTPGFCGVRSLPSFMIIRGGTAIGPYGSSNTEKVIQWLQEHRGT